jgi:hypothetical protein
VPARAYLDESGINDDSDAVILAGFLGGSRAWTHVDKLWREVLAAEGIADFHAKSFFDRALSPKSKPKAIRIAQDLIDAAFSRLLYPIGGVVPRSAFEKRQTFEQRILTGAPPKLAKTWTNLGKPSAPYFLIFPYIFVQSENTMPDVGPIHYVFDSQRDYEGYAGRVFNAWQSSGTGRPLGTITYGRRDDHPGLQLADMFAHLFFQKYRSKGFDGPLQEWCYGRLAQRDTKRNLCVFDERSIQNILLCLHGLKEPAPF